MFRRIDSEQNEILTPFNISNFVEVCCPRSTHILEYFNIFLHCMSRYLNIQKHSTYA